VRSPLPRVPVECLWDAFSRVCLSTLLPPPHGLRERPFTQRAVPVRDEEARSVVLYARALECAFPKTVWVGERRSFGAPLFPSVASRDPP
jgi:hypothetical protein